MEVKIILEVIKNMNKIAIMFNFFIFKLSHMYIFFINNIIFKPYAKVWDCFISFRKKRAKVVRNKKIIIERKSPNNDFYIRYLQYNFYFTKSANLHFMDCPV